MGGMTLLAGQTTQSYLFAPLVDDAVIDAAAGMTIAIPYHRESSVVRR